MPWLLHLGLNNAAVAALLAVPALVASRWGRRPALAHALWLLVLVKLVTPSFVPLRILPPAATAEPPAIAAAPQAPPAATTDSRIVFKPKSAAPARQPDLYDLLPPEVKMVLPPRPEEPLAQDDSFVEEEEFPPPSKANELEAPPAAPSPRPNAAFNTANMLSAVWLAGTAVWLGLALLRVRRFGVLLRNAEAAPLSLVNEVERLCRQIGLRRVPRVRLVPGPVAPLIWAAGGWPTLYFPKGLLDRLDERKRETLLIHELAHLRRGDHWVRWLELFATALFWWFPLTWLARREMRRVEEECCDGSVLESLPGSSRTYAEALLDTIDFLAEAPALPALASGISQADLLKRRLYMILHGAHCPRLTIAGRLALLSLALGMLPLLAAPQQKTAGPAPAAPPAPTAAAFPPGEEPFMYNQQSTNLQSAPPRWWSLTQSRDNKLIAVTAGNHEQTGEIYLFETPSGNLKGVIKHQTGIRCAVFSPDGKTLAAGSFDNSVRLYDVASLKLQAVGAGHTGAVNSIAWSDDAKMLVTGALDNSVRVWLVPKLPTIPANKPAISAAPAPAAAGADATKDAVKEAPKEAPKPAAEKPIEFTSFAKLEGHTNWVLSVALSKDGKTIVSGSRDNTARVWTMPPVPSDNKPVTGRSARLVLNGHANAVECVAFSPDETAIATGSWDATVRTWSLSDGTALRTFGGLPSGANGIAFSPDGKEIAVATSNSNSGQGGQTTRFNVENGSRAGMVNHKEAARCVCYAADGKSLLSLGEERLILRVGLKDGNAMGQIAAPAAAVDTPQIVLGIAYSHDSKKFAIAGENKKITIFTLADKQSRSFVAHDDVVSSLAFSPDGKTLASASYDRTIKLWDLANWKPGQAAPPAKVLKGHTNWVFAVAYSHAGRKLASAGYDRTVRIWDLSKWSGEQPAAQVLKAHNAGVRSVAFSPDDKLLASGSADRTIRIWDLATGEQSNILRGHKGTIRGVAFSHDGKTLASGSEDKTVKLWDLVADKAGKITGKERTELGPHADMVGAVAFSPKGRTLAATAWNGQIYLWDPDLAKRRAILSGHQDGIEALAFSPDSLTLASGSFDKTVKFWPAMAPPTPGAVSYQGHGDAVFTIALSKDGAWTATGARDGSIRIYERDAGKPHFTLDKAHPGGVNHLAYSSDSRILASVGKDKVVRLWKAATGEKLREFPAHTDEIRWVGFSPDDKLLATASKDKTAAIWNPADGKLLKKLDGHTEEVTCAVFSPDGNLLVTASLDRTFKIWDAKKWESKSTSSQTPNNGQILSATFSPDNKTLVLAHSQDLEIGPDGDLLRQQYRNLMFIDPATGKTKDAPGQFVHPDWITAVAYSTDGQSIITACRDMTVRLWSAKNGQVTKQFRAHNAGIAGLVVAEDVIATAGEDRQAMLWSAGSKLQGPRAMLAGHAGQIWFAEMTKDGNVMATGGVDKRVQVREGFHGTQPFAFSGSYAAVNSVAASRDGKLIASGHRDGKIEIWDAGSGKKIKTLAGHAMTVWSLVFSADGKQLFSASGDWNVKDKPGEVKMWDIEAGKPIRDFAGHAGLAYHVSLSPDGQTLASASHDQTIRLWDVGSGKPKNVFKVPGQAVRSVEFAPNGLTLVSASNVNVMLTAEAVKPDGTIIFWDLKEGKEKSRSALPNSMQVNRAKFSPDGKTLAIAANIPKPPAMVATQQVDVAVAPPAIAMAPQGPTGGRLLLWDVEKGAIRGEGTPPLPEMMLDLTFLPGGHTVVAVGGEYGTIGTVRFYDVAGGGRLGELMGHQLWCESVAVLPDGRVVSGAGVHDKPGELKIWQTKGIVPLKALDGHTGTVNVGAFRPDMKQLATGDAKGEIYLWDLSRWPPRGAIPHQVLRGHGSMVRSLIYSPDGKTLYSAADAGRVVVWNVEYGEEIRFFQASGKSIYGMALSPDGTKLVTAAGNWQQNTTGEVKVWDAATGTLIRELPGFERHAWTPVFSPDGRWLAVSGGQNTLRIYDTATWNEKSRLNVSIGVRALAFSPDGKTLASASETNNEPVVKLWDVDTGRERLSLAGLNELVFHLRFAPDSKTLLASCGDGRVLVWDVPPPKSAVARK